MSEPSERRDQIVREHFATLSALYDPSTFWRIERLGIGSGERCWEAGAGGGTVARWLAERVGEPGQVLATDVDVSPMAECAIALAADAGTGSGRSPVSAIGHPALEIRRHELGVEPAPGCGFDLAHARLVLEHLPDPGAALASMVGALRPGGHLLVESADPTLQPLACLEETGPAEHLANRLREAVWTIDATRVNAEFARTLPRLLRENGLEEVGAEVTMPAAGPDTARFQRTLIERRRDRLATTGQFTIEEIDRHLADVTSGRLNLTAFPAFAAWGRKPI